MRRIRLFPLPGVVLFPGTLLPLHIFEPRYKALVEHALAEDRLVGMSMIADLIPDEASTPGPPLRPFGGAGIIIEHERLDDGRYNILLEGTFRYRILREESSQPYRVATIEEFPAVPFSSAEEEDSAIEQVRGLFAALAPEMELPPLPSEALSAERLSGELALRLRCAPDELQELFEAKSLAERFDTIGKRLSQWKAVTDLLAPYRAAALDPQAN